MSADNWGICPRCKQAKEKEQELAQFRADQAYGTVSQDEYIALLEVAQQDPEAMKYELREDYELWIDTDEGTFNVFYKACCHTCNFSFSYEHKEKAYRKESHHNE